jgi:hypothetical protein
MQYIMSDDFLWVDETIRYAYSHMRQGITLRIPSPFCRLFLGCSTDLLRNFNSTLTRDRIFEYLISVRIII